MTWVRSVVLPEPLQPARPMMPGIQIHGLTAAVILVDDLSRTVRAVDIGVDTMRIALQSIWLGIALSLVLMVIAAFGLIPATLGATLQEVVDLATILNALRAIGRKELHEASAGVEKRRVALLGTAR